MTRQIVVVEDLSDWKHPELPYQLVHSDDYLTNSEYHRQKNLQVINLCRGSNYVSVAYYVSLLAEARRHRVLPSVKSMLDLSRRSLYSLDANALDQTVARAMSRHKGDEQRDRFEFEIFFGRCRSVELAELARQIFDLFPTPLLKVSLRHGDHWRIHSIRPMMLSKLGKRQQEFFGEAIDSFLKHRWRAPRSRNRSRFDLAILHNSADPQPPSNRKALAGFMKSGKQLGLNVELIGPADYARLAEYDALFIRDTTRIDHYTYQFAKRAESEGLVVIDDPQSILRCTNKVYLAELLRSNRLPTPNTVIVGRNDLEAAIAALGFPMVLKVPDGSFSQGVYKVSDREELELRSAELFRTSELILAQEFLYTEFDWRIGVLNGVPLYACQYFMSKKHWQIIHYDGAGGYQEGGFKTWPVEQAPHRVVQTALKASKLIGEGLYGVDVKQNGNDVFIIEVNDNPNLDAGVEDAFLKQELYRRIMAEFLRRLEQKFRI